MMSRLAGQPALSDASLNLTSARYYSIMSE